jgi:hypothetical protein
MGPTIAALLAYSSLWVRPVMTITRSQRMILVVMGCALESCSVGTMRLILVSNVILLGPAVTGIANSNLLRPSAVMLWISATYLSIVLVVT